MTNTPPMPATPEELAEAAGLRAENLFRTRQMLCSEAVLTTLNTSFRGPLDARTAAGLTAGLPEGLDSGCICGALSGGAIGLGLFLSADGYSRGSIRQVAATLHDWFKLTHGSSCCRVLRKKAAGDAEHFEQCVAITRQTTTKVAALILEARPELLRVADGSFLERRETLLGGLARRAWRAVAPRPAGGSPVENRHKTPPGDHPS